MFAFILRSTAPRYPIGAPSMLRFGRISAFRFPVCLASSMRVRNLPFELHVLLLYGDVMVFLVVPRLCSGRCMFRCLYSDFATGALRRKCSNLHPHLVILVLYSINHTSPHDLFALCWSCSCSLFFAFLLVRVPGRHVLASSVVVFPLHCRFSEWWLVHIGGVAVPLLLLPPL